MDQGVAHLVGWLVADQKYVLENHQEDPVQKLQFRTSRLFVHSRIAQIIGLGCIFGIWKHIELLDICVDAFWRKLFDINPSFFSGNMQDLMAGGKLHIA